MELLLKYFPELTRHQIEQFEALVPLYRDWNEKINVVSRKDIDNIVEKHILHSLAIAKFISFKKGTSIIDVGTGGGFPGIPLAIFFPDSSFHLVDSIGKKIVVVKDIIEKIPLKNASCEQIRSEQINNKLYDFVVCRAVSALPEFVTLTHHLVSKVNRNSIRNGTICLKGGDVTEEISTFKKKVSVTNINEFFEGEFFETKKIIYLQ